MDVKELEKSEIPNVVEMYGETAVPPEEKEAGMKSFEKEINAAFGKDHMLIAIENEDFVGFSWSQILEKGGKSVDKVIMLLIAPGKYGIGIGGALIEKEKEYAIGKGVDVFDIEPR